MSKIYTSVDQLIGHTPLLELTHLEKEFNLQAKIYAKLEYFNPAGSVKDRIAKTYGKPKVTDKYSNSSDSYYQQDEYWFYSLREGSRELSAVWGYDSALSDELESVALKCTVSSGFYEGTGQLVLYYDFKNTSAVEDEQDEVF